MKSFPNGMNPFNKYKFFSKKCILFRKNEKSFLLDALIQLNKENSTIEINKHSKYKKRNYNEEKNSYDSGGIKIKYLKTQTYQSSYSRKKILGNNNILRRDKTKYFDDNNINSSKRTIGPTAIDFKNALSNQDKQLKNMISSSEGSKDIDFDKNANVVINPYCILLDQKKEQNFHTIDVIAEIEKQNKKKKRLKLQENENNHEIKFYRNKELSGGNKIIFTNIEKKDEEDKSDGVKL